LPKHIETSFGKIILVAVGVIVAAIGAGLIIMGAGVPATPLVASIETGLIEESAILTASIDGWLGNVASMIG
jgi:hypothetical protein